MIMTWCLPDTVRNEILEWCEMPLEVWNSLALIHMMAVTTEYYTDVDPIPNEETSR